MFEGVGVRWGGGIREVGGVGGKGEGVVGGGGGKDFRWHRCRGLLYMWM